MATSDDIFDIELDDAANRSGGVIFSVLILVTGIMDWQSGFYVEGSLPILLFVILAAIVFSVWQTLGFWNINQRKILLVIIYQMLMVTGIIFSFPLASVYVMIGIQVIYLSHYWFGYRGSLTNIIVYILAILISMFVQSEEVTLSSWSDFVRTSSILIVLSVSLVSLLEITIERINKERESNKRLVLEKRRIYGLMNSMTDAVLATDKNGTILEYNSATLELIDKNDNLHGKVYSEVFNIQNEAGEHIDLIAQARDTKRSINRDDLYLFFSNNERARLKSIVTPLSSEYEDSFNGYTLVFRDITREKSVEEERNEFISVISHELRTPVAVTEGSIELAKMANSKSGDNPDIKKPLSEAHDNVKYLGRLVNELVVLTMADSKDQKVEANTFSLVELINKIADDFRHEILNNSNQLKVEIEREVSEISSNQTIVTEVVQHLLSNANKFTNKGKITLRAKRQSKSRVVVEVIDTGAGIAKSAKKHVFEKFFQEADFSTREAGGSGLGLFVSKRLAVRLGGNLTFSSELKKGSVFRFTIIDHSSRNK